MSTFIQQEINRRTRWVYFTKYRWVAHVAYWTWVMMAGTILRIDGPVTFSVVFEHFFLANLNIATFYYFYCLYLIPYLFKRNKNLLFWTVLAGSFFALTAFDVYCNSRITPFSGENTVDLSEGFWTNYWKVLYGYVVNFLIFSMILFFMEKNEENSIIMETEEEKKQIELVKLDLLKTNISPDFMMRSLKQLKRAATAQEENTPQSIITFSELLRYRLYRGKQLQTPLKEEIDALKTFISFISLDQENKLQVELNIEGDSFGKSVAALALINILEPFCEVMHTTPTTLLLQLHIAADQLDVLLVYSRPAEGQLLEDLQTYGDNYQSLYGEKIIFSFENCEAQECRIEVTLQLL